MRCVRSPGSTRRDSERTISFFWDINDSVPGDRGHLSILQLRLREKERLRKCRVLGQGKLTAITYKIFLDRIPGVPWCWDGEMVICSFCSSGSSWGLGSSSRLGSLWVEASLLWTEGSGLVTSSSELSECKRPWGACGLCSMVSCSGLVVSWITRFILREGYLIEHYDHVGIFSVFWKRVRLLVKQWVVLCLPPLDKYSALGYRWPPVLDHQCGQRTAGQGWGQTSLTWTEWQSLNGRWKVG